MMWLIPDVISNIFLQQPNPQNPLIRTLLCPRQERQETTASYVSPQSSIDVDAIMTGNAPSRQEVEKQKQQLRNEAKGK